MEYLRNSTPQADAGRVVVSGATLGEAFKNVKARFGPDAVIAGSRTRNYSDEEGRATAPMVEVTVAIGGGNHQLPLGKEFPERGLTAEIRYEVDRLERMVEDIIKPREDGTPQEPVNGSGFPLAEFLRDNGASGEAVDRMLTRFAGETGLDKGDRPGAITWLENNLGNGPGPIEEWRGTHAFFVEHPSDRLDLVLRLAKRATESGRHVLAVSVLPDPDRDLSRLQNQAESGCFDAAVVRDASQLGRLETELEGYDLILVDLPSLVDPAMVEDGTVPVLLNTMTGIKRHLRVPLDRDFLDLDDLRDSARFWGCDWLVLDRVYATRRPAKILDLVETIPLPVFLLAENGTTPGSLAAGTSQLILDRILAAAPGPRFKPGLKAENA